MWSVVSHKSSSIFSVVMAERDESLTNPPLHLIHMSICLLSMPLSKDYWCPAFDIWHIMCHNVSSNELNLGRRKKTQLPSVSRIAHNSFLCVCGCVCSSLLILWLWVLWLLRFTGEVLSDLCRTLHCVIWCVSPHMSSTQDILNLTLGGWAHNPADIKLCCEWIK